MVFIAQNGKRFDSNRLQTQLDLVGKQLPLNCFFEDTLEIFRKLVPKHYKKKSFALNALSEHFLGSKVPHRAKGDVETLWNLLKKFVPQNTLQFLQEMCLQHLEINSKQSKKSKTTKENSIQLYKWNQNSCFLDTYCVIWRYCIQDEFQANTKIISAKMTEFNKIMELHNKNNFQQAQDMMWSLAISIAKSFNQILERGQFGSINNLFDGLISSKDERDFFEVKWKLESQCDTCNHKEWKQSHQLGILFPLDMPLNNAEQAVEQWMESLTLFSHCNQINCIGTMDDTLQEFILPKCLVLEYPIQSNETKFIGQNLHLNIQDKSYKLHGIIYFQNGHFWCQFLNTNGKDKQKGWYHYNDIGKYRMCTVCWSKSQK